MRWVVSGAAGMLGRDMVERLEGEGEVVRALRREDLDVTDAQACRRAVADADVVVGCAAWTAVDDAEDREADAFAVNATGAHNLATAAAAAGALMVQVSTDYVFAGDAGAPYAEDAALAPRSAYGRTKAAGEWAVRSAGGRHLVLRTAWLYGAGGRCFPRTIARAAAGRDHLDVIDDQTGQPTWTLDVADLTVRLVRAQAPSGAYHATSGGRASWFELARAVVAAAGHDPAMVRPTDSASYGARAPRPAWSVLGHDALHALGVEPIGDWRERWAAAADEVLAAG